MSLFFRKNKTQVLFAVGNDKEFRFENPISLKPKINNESLSFKFKEEKGIQYLIFNKKKYEVQILSKKQNKYEIMVNGVSFFFTIESEYSFERRKLLESQNSGTKKIKIMAPMPGKVLDILVEEGSEVRKGDSLLILEAMKMQNEIQSVSDGIVKSVAVKSDQNVMKNDLLIEIE